MWSFLKKAGNWWSNHLFDKKQRRFFILLGTAVILFFQFLAFLLCMPIILSKASDYEKYTGTCAYSETRLFDESRRTKLGTKFYKEEKLALKLQELDEEFVLSYDYKTYWPAILSGAQPGVPITVYLRPYAPFNPMQIESNGHVLMPLEIHRQWQIFLLVMLEFFALCFAIAVYICLKNYLRYDRKRDVEKWKQGWKGKWKVIQWWTLGS